MKVVTSLVVGVTVCVAVAGARHQLLKPMSLVNKGRITHHVFPPLTAAQITAAFKAFNVKQPPSYNSSPFTLTPQVPFYAPLQATLSASGSWYSQSQANCIVEDSSGWVQVNIANADPTKSYVVTFNCSVVGPSVTASMISAIEGANGETTVGVNPTLTFGSTVSIPVVVASGANVGEIDFTVPPSSILTIESVSVQPF